MSPEGLRYPLIFIKIGIPLKKVSFIKIYKKLTRFLTFYRPFFVH